MGQYTHYIASLHPLFSSLHLTHILLQTPHHTNTGKENWDAAELDFTELQALVLDELSSRDGVLRMVCKVTDVEGREGALAKSLIPNPFAGKGEKQVKQRACTPPSPLPPSPPPPLFTLSHAHTTLSLTLLTSHSLTTLSTVQGDARQHEVTLPNRNIQMVYD